MADHSVEGEAVLIAGGAENLGGLIARDLAAHGAKAVAYRKTAAALSPFSKIWPTDIEHIVPYIRFMVSDGWWMTGQTILVNGGYATK